MNRGATVRTELFCTGLNWFFAGVIVAAPRWPGDIYIFWPALLVNLFAAAFNTFRLARVVAVQSPDNQQASNTGAQGDQGTA